MQTVKIGQVEFNNTKPFALIAGPCVMESRGHSIMMATRLQEICRNLGLGFVFKTSFDKANRTSASSYRGVGMDAAIKVFSELQSMGIPCITDVHTEEQCTWLAPHVAALQIPALLSRQTDLIAAAAATGLPVNIKKGQWMHPNDMQHAAQKADFNNVLLTERGSMFGYNHNVVDMRSLVTMAGFGLPVVFDCTHSVQAPNALGGTSGGQRSMARHLARAAVAVGIAGLFMEVHNYPNQAPCDGPVMQHLEHVETILRRLMKIDGVVK